MTDALPIARWLDIVEREYLSTFIGDGGAAIKFAVAPAEESGVLREALKPRSDALGYTFVEVDAVSSRVHMPQDIFFKLAQQIDWRLLARRVILRLLREEDFRVDGIDPGASHNLIDAVAEANRLETKTLVMELRPALERRIFKDPNLARAFRIAMTHLCLLERETGANEPYRGQPLLDWLTGVNPRVGPVRPFDIHTVINRTTARYFFESTLHWVRFAGCPGTLILLDNRRVTIPRNPKDGKRFYTRATTMDHYELLRELIDDMDRLNGLLLLVVTADAFLDPHSPRGFHIYSALQTRVMNDVRDRNIVNPVAALVRLQQGTED